jgi:hypothetical protein
MLNLHSGRAAQVIRGSCLLLLACFSAVELRVIEHEIAGSRGAGQSRKIDLLPLSSQESAKLIVSEKVSTRVEQLMQDIRANPWDTQASLHLSEELEAEGNDTNAEQQLIWAAAHDHGIVPKWALANFYLRRGDKERFFEWANRYRQDSADPSKGLLRLMLEAEPDLSKLLTRIRPLKCPELAEFVALLDERSLPSGSIVADMGQCKDTNSQERWAQHIGFLLDRNHPILAKEQWEGLGLSENLFNADFRYKISEKGFDWRINRSPGISVVQHDNQAGAEIQVASDAADGSVVLFQPVELVPRAAYNISVQSEMEDNSLVPLRLEFVLLSQGKVLGSNIGDPLQPAERPIEWLVKAPESDQTLALALVYHRRRQELIGDQIIQVKSVDLVRIDR